MPKVKMGFIKLSIPEQVDRSRHINTQMTGNVNFPTPNPPLADQATAADALELAYNESRSGDKVKMAIMRIRQRELMSINRRLAAYVQDESGGDEEIILTSGFDVVRRGTPLYTGQVLNLRTNKGINPGSIRAIWNKVTGAGAYIVDVSDSGPLGESFRLYRVVVSTRVDITDLTPPGLYTGFVSLRWDVPAMVCQATRA